MINDFFSFEFSAKIMDTLFLFPFFIFLLVLLILGVSMYFIIVRKRVEEFLNYRRETKNIKSELWGILVKKGCKKGGVSL